ncbi:dihydrofolate reductase family protein [Paenibacillus sp. B-A-8]|uniref:dihydrofolate reductase family protein n=1 Tax=Paenibacillus sp. B-A-8 TaxID=3400419 RepID=UPI003B024D08
MLTEQVSDAYLAHLKEIGNILYFWRIKKLDFAVVVEKLKQLFLIDELLLERWGVLNGSFLNEDLIDELSLVFLFIFINYLLSNAKDRFLIQTVIF